MSSQTYTAFGGIRNTVPDERQARAVTQAGGIDQRTDLVAAQNIDLDNTGRASRRAGQTVVAAGAAHSLWSDGVTCLFVQGGVLTQLHPDYSTTALASGLGGGPLRYVGVNDRIYWSDGVATGMLADGLAQPWGMPIPTQPPRAGVIAGQLGAGTYQYAMTYLRADGQESGAGLATRIDLPERAGITFAWAPPPDPAVTAVALYLSEPNSETLYRALVVPAGAGGAAYAGGALATPLLTQWQDAPPPGQDLAYSRGRIYIASGSVLYATGALGYGYCDLRDYLALDNSRIAFVAGLQHGLYVGTELGVYFLQGDALADLAVNSVVDGYAVAGSAVIVDGFAASGNPALAGSQCLLFACELGVCLGTPDGTVTNLTLDRYKSKIDLIGTAAFRSAPALRQYLLTTRT